MLRFLLITLLLPSPALSQIFADRLFAFDPLGDRTPDTVAFSFLSRMSAAAEFGRYTDSGSLDHRWNAKLAGAAEMLRWDSTASVGLVGTMEVIVDPHNDIAFNPRAIFWEEGLLATFRLGHNESMQAGYMHRCKHDIDNLELLAEREERTLIYGSITTRLNARPRPISGDTPWLLVSGSARNDVFVVLLDDRYAAEARGIGRSLETLADAITLTAAARYAVRGPFTLHVAASWMLSAFGRGTDFGERFAGVTVLGSVPFVELGADVSNPRGATFSLFVRGEWQRDAGIRMRPADEKLILFGVRVAEI